MKPSSPLPLPKSKPSSSCISPSSPCSLTSSPLSRIDQESLSQTITISGVHCEVLRGGWELLLKRCQT